MHVQNLPLLVHRQLTQCLDRRRQRRGPIPARLADPVHVRVQLTHYPRVRGHRRGHARQQVPDPGRVADEEPTVAAQQTVHAAGIQWGVRELRRVVVVLSHGFLLMHNERSWATRLCSCRTVRPASRAASSPDGRTAAPPGNESPLPRERCVLPIPARRTLCTT